MVGPKYTFWDQINNIQLKYIDFIDFSSNTKVNEQFVAFIPKMLCCFAGH